MTSPTYTLATAAMTLASARCILATLEQGWSDSQIARARAVARVWDARRARQAARKAAR